MSLPRTPALAADCVIIDPLNRLLLVRRGGPPFKGQLALPGGFVNVGESVQDACRREVREETGIACGDLKLIGIFSDPNRDPRGHTVSVAFLALVGQVEATAGDDAQEVQWVADIRQLELAFDHRHIIEQGLRLAHPA